MGSGPKGDDVLWNTGEKFRPSIRTHVRTYVPHCPGLGPLEAGWDLPEAGWGLPEAGLGFHEAGSGLLEAGLGLPKAGLGFPEAGLSPPQSWLGPPRVWLRPSEAGCGLPEVRLCMY